MSVTRKYRNGALVGFECGNGHNHGSQVEADTCDPGKFAAQQSAEQKQREKDRRGQIAESKEFKDAVAAAKKLGATDADAEEVVLVNGCERVLGVLASVAGLGIGKIKVPKPVQPNPPATT
jgi:hypothetical protein